MATTTNITTTYAGQFAGRYIGAALLSANTISQGGVEVKPNIKFKEVVKRLDLASLVADQSCAFTANGTVTLTERIIEPKKLQVNLELCKDDFESDWNALEMGFSQLNDNLPSTFEDFLISRIAAKVAEKTEIDLWGGDKDNAGEFDGILTLLAADTAFKASDRDVVGATVSAVNVIEKLGEVVDQIPSALYGREDAYLYISQNIARAYVRALGGFGAAGLGGNGTGAQGTQWFNNGSLSFDGVKLFVANGLPDNKMVATVKENLVFGTGLMEDYNEVKILPMADLDGSRNVRFIMRYSAAIQYGISEDMVGFGIA